jgi:peptide-methionine (S)-S-oxide reductase
MSAATPPPTSPPPVPPKKGPPPANLETAVFGTGCFWCSQAVFERLDGVWEATCGYMGGTVANPTYEQVCTELTGHAEVTQVKFDPKVVSYEQLLEWFWHMHDPTTLNRQGADTGTSYRSVIFYFSDAQKAAAEKSKAAAQKNFKDPIVTEITKAATFYKAEDYHQEYFNNNSSQGYCQIIIAPKLDKLKLPETPTTAGNGTAK